MRIKKNLPSTKFVFIYLLLNMNLVFLYGEDTTKMNSVSDRPSKHKSSKKSVLISEVVDLRKEFLKSRAPKVETSVNKFDFKSLSKAERKDLNKLNELDDIRANMKPFTGTHV